MSSIHRITRASAVAVGAAALAAFAIVPAAQAGVSSSFIGPFTHNDQIASTVPANGDVNPYGVAVVPASTGSLVKGDVLVSNFNNSANLQGTGTTIVQISPGGQQTLLFGIPDACHVPRGQNVRVQIIADNMLRPVARDLKQMSYVMLAVGFAEPPAAGTAR